MGDVGELAAFRLAIGFSPLHIGLLLLLNMDKGSSHRTGLDLLAAGALLGLGMKELLNQFCAMPLPLLLAISAALEVARPDALFLFTKTAGSLLLTPLITLILAGPERVLTLLERGKQWLFAKGGLPGRAMPVPPDSEHPVGEWGWHAPWLCSSGAAMTIPGLGHHSGNGGSNVVRNRQGRIRLAPSKT